MPNDQSEAIEAALQHWLKREIPKLEKRCPHLGNVEDLING